jgi:hypothetical protein
MGEVIDTGTETSNKKREWPFLAFDGANYLLTWSSTKNDLDGDGRCDSNEGSCWDAYGLFISPSGQLQGTPFLIAGGSLNQFVYPLFGGGQYLLVINSVNHFDGKTGNVTGKFMLPRPRITSPNGGEFVPGGSPYEITWETGQLKTPAASVKISYSKDNGTTWIPIATRLGNPGSHSWDVPAVKTDKTRCRVKVVLKDANGKTIASDISDETFTIQAVK